MTALQLEHAVAFDALDFIRGDSDQLTGDARDHIYANAKDIERMYRQMLRGNAPQIAERGLARLHRVLKERN